MHYSKAHIWFVGPAVLLMFIILIFPILLAGGISFTNYNLGNPSFDWIGLEKKKLNIILWEELFLELQKQKCPLLEYITPLQSKNWEETIEEYTCK